MNVAERILVALDVPTLREARSNANVLGGLGVGFKVGMQLNTAAGTPAVVEAIGDRVFLDLKYHDIPNTVAGAVTAACRLNVWMLNLHCSGGRSMMEAAMKAALDHEKIEGHRPLIIGVTVLTSLNRQLLDEIGFVEGLPAGEIATRLAVLAEKCGLDGVVAPGSAAADIRKRVQPSFKIVSPGIRKKGTPPDDQNLTSTVSEAVHNGSDYFVIGRPILGECDRVLAAKDYIDEAESAFGIRGDEVPA